MSSKLKKIIIGSVLVLIGGIIGYNYVMHGGARDLSTEKSEFSLTSKSILDEFSNNTETSNKKYLEKAVEISGTITSIKNTEVILDNVIICTLKNTDSSIKVGDKTTLKGRVVGFDDLMGELKLDQCFINK